MKINGHSEKQPPKDREPREKAEAKAHAAKRSVKVKNIAAAVFIISAVLASAAVYIFGGSRAWSRLYVSFGLAEKLPEPMENAASVYYFDVGQGDCSLILADGKSVLIDSGEYDKAGKIISVLRMLGVERLDYVIATHPHSDHIGAMAEVLSAVPAGTLIMPDISSFSGSYKGMIAEAEKSAAKIYGISEDDMFSLGENSTVFIFCPPKDLENLNNDSLVIKFVYGGTSFLFCGDIEEEAEGSLLEKGVDIDSDVIKVPHHGSSSSDSREFVERVSPEYAVISVGESNDYGHPHKSTLRLYSLLGARIYRTDMDGNIAAYSDGESISFAA